MCELNSQTLFKQFDKASQVKNFFFFLIKSTLYLTHKIKVKMLYYYYFFDKSNLNIIDIMYLEKIMLICKIYFYDKFFKL